MSSSMACLAGAAVYRLQERGLFQGKEVGRRETPFGRSEAIFLVEDVEAPFYLVPQHGTGKFSHSASFINYRANLYALKDLGVRCVLGFGAAGAISHNYNVGDIVLVSDLIDRTTRRPTTFFENAPTGMLRQFPVFCPGLRRAMADCLDGMGCGFHQNSTLVVTEGPRLETPAEIRFLATAGAELVSHHFAPEAFLAKELELCYAGAAYVANYAETGSRYRPFSATDLFGGLAVRNEVERLNRATEMVANLVVLVSQRVLNHSAQCECNQTMRGQVEKFGLSTDWRDWFGPADSAGKGRYNTIPRRTDDLPVHVSKRI